MKAIIVIVIAIALVASSWPAMQQAFSQVEPNNPTTTEDPELEREDSLKAALKIRYDLDSLISDTTKQKANEKEITY